CSSPSPRSRCRSPWSSRSRPGRRGGRNARRRRARPPRPRTFSPGCPPQARPQKKRTSRRFDARTRRPGATSPPPGHRRDQHEERNAVKFMHTADWHVGKVLKGRDRLGEQRAVLAEIAAIAEENQVDAVLVAGDVYESAAPSAQAQHLVVQALLR